jgi:hypothetical protein
MWPNNSSLTCVALHCYLVQESKAAGAETKKWIEKIERIEVRNITGDGWLIDRHPQDTSQLRLHVHAISVLTACMHVSV